MICLSSCTPTGRSSEISILFWITGSPNVYRWVAEEAQRRGMQFYWATAWQMYSAIDAIVNGREPVPSLTAGFSEAH